MAGKQGQRGFGHIRRLPSKRYQASYIGPDTVRHKAPTTFATRKDAEGWLAERRREISGEEWSPPVARPKPLTFAEYGTGWLEHRDLKPRTRAHYRSLFDTYVVPTF